MAYEKVAGEMVDIACKPWFNLYRLVTILFGMALFLVVVPLFLLLASCGIEEYFIDPSIQGFTHDAWSF